MQDKKINIGDRVTVHAYRRDPSGGVDWARRDRLMVSGYVLSPSEPSSEFNPPRVLVDFGGGAAAVHRDEIVTVDARGSYASPQDGPDPEGLMTVDMLTDGPTKVRVDWVIRLEPAPPGGWSKRAVDDSAVADVGADQRLDHLAAAMLLPSNGVRDLLNKIKTLAPAMQTEAGDDIIEAINAMEGCLSDIVACVRHPLVGNGYIAEAKGHRSKGASVSDALRRLADAIDGARPGDSVASLADRLTKAEQRLDDPDEALGQVHQRLDNLATVMREFSDKESVHPSVRFLASTIALNLGRPSRG